MFSLLNETATTPKTGRGPTKRIFQIGEPKPTRRSSQIGGTSYDRRFNSSCKIEGNYLIKIKRACA